MRNPQHGLKKWVAGIVVVAALLALYGFLALRSIHYSAPIGEPRGWMAQEWDWLVDPPLFNGPPISIPQSDISVSETAGKKALEWRIETKFPGTASDYEAYNRRVHAVRMGEASSASADLEGGRIFVTHLALAGDYSHSIEGKGQVYQMPDWKAVPEEGDSEMNLDELDRYLEEWKAGNWKVGLKMRLVREGADGVFVKRARLIDLDHEVEAADTTRRPGFSKRSRHTHAEFEIASRYPANIALAMDVIYDWERDIEVTRKPGAVGKGGEFVVEPIGWADVDFPLPLDLSGINIPGYHSQRHDLVAPNTTAQTFSGRPGNEGTTVFLNVRPFVRQDLIVCRFFDKDGKSLTGSSASLYPCSAPATAPFHPCTRPKSAASAKVDIARRIDRVIIPLGRLPFDPIEPGIDDLLDIPLPRVSWKDGYRLKKAIEEISGLRIEIDWNDFEKKAFVEATFEDVTARELIEIMSAGYGRPRFDRKAGTLTFEKKVTFWENLKRNLADLLP